MKQEVEFKVGLENRKSIQTGIVYTDDMIHEILKSKIKLISFMRNGKVLVIGKLKKIELVHISDDIVRFKGIITTDFDIDLSGLEIKLSFLHAKNKDTEVKVENIISIDVYFVNSELEQILKELNINKYGIVDKFNKNIPITNAKVMFEDLHEYLICRNEKIKVNVDKK